MKLGYKAQLGVLLAAQAAALAFVALFTYLPSLGKIEDLDRKMEELAQRQAELCRRVETNPNPDADIARSRAEIRRLENCVPSESRVGWISARLALVMGANRIDIRSSSDWQESGEKTPAAELKQLRKSLTVQCSAQDLEAFLEALNKLPFVVVVESLEVSRDAAWGQVAAQLRLGTFVLRGGPVGLLRSGQGGGSST